MKLVRFGPKGCEKPGLVDLRGVLRDLSGVVDDFTPAVLAPERLAGLAALAPESLPAVAGTPRLGVPVRGIGKFLGIGLNYHDHSLAHDGTLPQEPVIFTKAVSCLNGPNDDIVLPREPQKPDWEAELGVVIGTTARYVARDAALSHVAGYVVVNDVTKEKSFYKEIDSPNGTRARAVTPSGPSAPGS